MELADPRAMDSKSICDVKYTGTAIAGFAEIRPQILKTTLLFGYGISGA